MTVLAILPLFLPLLTGSTYLPEYIRNSNWYPQQEQEKQYILKPCLTVVERSSMSSNSESVVCEILALMLVSELDKCIEHVFQQHFSNVIVGAF